MGANQERDYFPPSGKTGRMVFLIYGFFVLSGMFGLVYEVIWDRYLIGFIGVTSHAVIVKAPVWGSRSYAKWCWLIMDESKHQATIPRSYLRSGFLPLIILQNTAGTCHHKLFTAQGAVRYLIMLVAIPAVRVGLPADSTRQSTIRVPR